MGFVGSYLWKLRQVWGSAPLLTPGISVFISNPAGEILFGLRSDTKSWGYIGGHMELNEGIEECAYREVKEETGLTITNLQLIGIMTDPQKTYIKYPNGHEVYCPGYVFIAQTTGTPVLGDDEHHEWRFFPMNALPSTEGLGYAGHTTRLFLEWHKTKQFQIS